MSTTTLEAMHERLKKMLKDEQIVDRTHDFKVGGPSGARHQEMLLMSTAQRQELKVKFEAQSKKDCPYGPYSANLKSEGLGWCQITFMADTAKLKYIVYGFHLGVGVRVQSLRGDNKVTVWARSEEYDSAAGCMKLQPPNEGWSFSITVDKARQIIRADRKNWKEYNMAMLTIQLKEEAKLAKARPPRKNLSTNTTLGPLGEALLGLRDGALGASGKRSKATAKKTLAFPGAASDELSPPTKRARAKEDPKKANAKKKTPTQLRPVVLKGMCNTPALKELLKEKRQRQKKVFGQNRDYQVFETILHRQKIWDYNLDKDPGAMASKMLRVFKGAGDAAGLFTCAMGLLKAVKDKDIMRNAAQSWRSRTKQKVRARLNRNNQELNELTQTITQLEESASWKRQCVLVDDEDPDSSEPEASQCVIDLQDSSEPEADGVKSGGPAGEPADTDNDVQADKGPEQPDEAKGPDVPDKANGPDKQPDKTNVSAQTDFTKADADFDATRQIPKTETARAHFRKCYPNGYPADKDFVKHEHYIVTKRLSVSGYQSVGYTSATRDQTWRVKIDGHTIGRYDTKAQACEETYWYNKQAEQMDEFARGNTMPSAMFE